MIDLSAAFDSAEAEFLRFEQVENRLHARPDICAFLLLESLAPIAKGGMVIGAGHDVIYLATDCETLARVASQEDIVNLSRCGVFYDSDSDGLAMYV